MTTRRQEIEADAVLAEASAVARANAVLDAQASEIATERLDSVLMLVDLLIAARRITMADANWILPAMGYEVEGAFLPTGDEASEDDEDSA